MRSTQSRATALCGVLGALSFVLMLLGLIPFATYCAPMFAAFLLIPVREEYGARYALLLYGCVALLSVLFLPDKEPALLYTLVLGYYPVLRGALGRVRSAPLRWAAKLAVFNGGLAAVYALLLAVMASPALLADFQQAGRVLLAVTLAAGNFAFWMFDRALLVLTAAYRQKLGPKLRRMLHNA